MEAKCNPFVHIPEYKTVVIAEYWTKMLNNLIIFSKHSVNNTDTDSVLAK